MKLDLKTIVGYAFIGLNIALGLLYSLVGIALFIELDFASSGFSFITAIVMFANSVIILIGGSDDGEKKTCS